MISNLEKIAYALAGGNIRLNTKIYHFFEGIERGLSIPEAKEYADKIADWKSK